MNNKNDKIILQRVDVPHWVAKYQDSNGKRYMITLFGENHWDTKSDVENEIRKYGGRTRIKENIKKNRDKSLTAYQSIKY